MYEKGVLHRDISVGNIMYRVDPEEGVVGVLNDFDMAIRVGRKAGSTSKQRTGTFPYIAMELLRAIECMHRYRHDLESIMYCIMDLTMANVLVRNEDREGVWKPGLWRWHQNTVEALADSKSAFITNPMTADFKVYKDKFGRFLPMVRNLKLLFSDAYGKLNNQDVKNDPNFNYDTCDDVIDFKKFREILATYKIKNA